MQTSRRRAGLRLPVALPLIASIASIALSLGAAAGWAGERVPQLLFRVAGTQELLYIDAERGADGQWADYRGYRGPVDGLAAAPIREVARDLIGGRVIRFVSGAELALPPKLLFFRKPALRPAPKQAPVALEPVSLSGPIAQALAHDAAKLEGATPAIVRPSAGDVAAPAPARGRRDDPGVRWMSMMFGGYQKEILVELAFQDDHGNVIVQLDGARDRIDSWHNLFWGNLREGVLYQLWSSGKTIGAGGGQLGNFDASFRAPTEADPNAWGSLSYRGGLLEVSVQDGVAKFRPQTSAEVAETQALLQSRRVRLELLPDLREPKKLFYSKSSKEYVVVTAPRTVPNGWAVTVVSESGEARRYELDRASSKFNGLGLESADLVGGGWISIEVKDFVDGPEGELEPVLDARLTLVGDNGASSLKLEPLPLTAENLAKAGMTLEPAIVPGDYVNPCSLPFASR